MTHKQIDKEAKREANIFSNRLDYELSRHELDIFTYAFRQGYIVCYQEFFPPSKMVKK